MSWKRISERGAGDGNDAFMRDNRLWIVGRIDGAEIAVRVETCASGLQLSKPLSESDGQLRRRRRC